jgi:hypothetical protein
MDELVVDRTDTDCGLLAVEHCTTLSEVTDQTVIGGKACGFDNG